MPVYYKACLVKEEVSIQKFFKHSPNDLEYSLVDYRGGRSYVTNFNDGFGWSRAKDRKGKPFAFLTIEEARADFLNKITKKRNALLSKVNRMDDVINNVPPIEQLENQL